MPNARISTVALCMIIASAGLSLNCGGCDDDDGDWSIDGGGLADDAGEGDDGGPGGDGGANDEPMGLDILWVIDNSGSMCEEQAALRQNFAQFIAQITERGIDFNIGVTTTQMDDYPIEPVAEPGRLQATPQPLPSSLINCRGDEGDPNDPTDGFQPIRDAIEQAVACSSDPTRWEDLLAVTDDEIRCQITPGADNCSCNDSRDDDDVCRRGNLFPRADDGGESPYREIPKVLSFSDYQNPESGELDAATRKQLHEDFACMSFVGTSGYSIEKGLAAAAKAVSPEMTGGTVENPTDASAPNHGLLRDNAKFSVIFVTDENDCSHDGTLDEASSCGGDVCAFANHPDVQDSPLIPSAELAQTLQDNLSASKGYAVGNDAVIAASLHGRWKRYGATPDYPADQPPATNECAETPSESIREQSSCASAFGTAYSGDRYERYLRAFNPAQVFPKIPDDPNAHLPGLICTPEQVSDTFEAIGQTLADSVD